MKNQVKVTENIELFYGTKFNYNVPDWNRHENQVANFMLTTDSRSVTLNIMYCNNESVCTCKDGWIKFENILSKVKHGRNSLSVTEQELKDYLKSYYGDQFDETTLHIQKKLSEDEKSS